jgi:magnesium-transporting ATPase (P-type)
MVVSLRYYSGICLKGLRRSVENISQDRPCPGWDSNWALPEQKSIALLLTQLAQSSSRGFSVNSSSVRGRSSSYNSGVSRSTGRGNHFSSILEKIMQVVVAVEVVMLLVVVVVVLVWCVLYCLCSFVCSVLFECCVLFCVICVICVLCLIVVLLPPGKTPVAV